MKITVHLALEYLQSYNFYWSNSRSHVYNSTLKFNTCIFACYIFGLLKLRYALKQLYMNKLPNEVCPMGYV